MPRPSYSCLKSSCSLPRYLLIVVPPRHTKEKPAKPTWLNLTESVPRYTLKGSTGSQTHLTSIPQAPRWTGSKQQAGLGTSRAFHSHVLSSLLGFRTGLLQMDLGSPQCNVLIAQHDMHWTVQDCSQWRVSAQSQKGAVQASLSCCHL